MNRTVIRNVVVCALVGSLTVAQPLTAQSDKSAATQQAWGAPAEKKAKRKTYKGTIETIDPAARIVTVKKALTSKTFKFAADAKFATSNNENSSLAPLQVGDVVNVRFTDDGDVATAHHIARAAKNPKPIKKPE